MIDPDTYADHVDRLLKEREARLTDVDAIFDRGLLSYALYGERSPLRDVLSARRLGEPPARAASASARRPRSRLKGDSIVPGRTPGVCPQTAPTALGWFPRGSLGVIFRATSSSS